MAKNAAETDEINNNESSEVKAALAEEEHTKNKKMEHEAKTTRESDTGPEDKEKKTSRHGSVRSETHRKRTESKTPESISTNNDRKSGDDKSPSLRRTSKVANETSEKRKSSQLLRQESKSRHERKKSSLMYKTMHNFSQHNTLSQVKEAKDNSSLDETKYTTRINIKNDEKNYSVEAIENWKIVDELRSKPKEDKKPIRGSITYDTKLTNVEEDSSQIGLEKKLKYQDDVQSESIDTSRDTDTDQAESIEKKLRFGEEKKEKKTEAKFQPTTMRLEYGKTPKTCELFLRVQEYSKLFVDGLTDEALSKGKNLREQSAIKIIEGIEYRMDSSTSTSSISSIGTYVCIFEWPTIEQFTVDLGQTKIEEYLSYWKFEEDWKHCINFLNGESDAACDFYHYEAIFSIPCKQYPIPQATASVYFTYEVSRVRYKHCLVDMYYRFEGQRLIHTPGKFTFQENRLFNIIDAKINFYKTLTF